MENQTCEEIQDQQQRWGEEPLVDEEDRDYKNDEINNLNANR